MIRRTLTLALALVAMALPAYADTTFQYLFSGGYAISISSDGTVVTGNKRPDYGPFRWTSGDTVSALSPAANPSNGKACVSYDGTRVCATIPSADSLPHATPGLWTLGSGWKYLSLPPGAIVEDNDGGSPWGISGDGNTVVGLFWTSTGKGHAYKWTEATGGVDLGSSGRSSRANGANYDGSVIVGWDESPTQGFRRPSAWVNGVLEDISGEVNGEGWCSNSSGDVIGGYQADSLGNYQYATLWHRVGNSYGPAQLLPLVPGTETGGINAVEGITADGKMAVGYCSFAGDPFYTTGFVWTDSTGCMDVVQFLANYGILPDPSFTIQELTGITPDGSMIIGIGHDTVAPGLTRGFLIHIDRAAVGVPRNLTPASRLLSAAPNPIASASTLTFSLSAATTGSLTIHDSAGRLVKTLASGALAAGPHSYGWDVRDESGARVPAGVYFTQLVAGSHREMGKLVVVK